jgi:hypothetical protein
VVDDLRADEKHTLEPLVILGEVLAWVAVAGSILLLIIYIVLIQVVEQIDTSDTVLYFDFISKSFLSTFFEGLATVSIESTTILVIYWFSYFALGKIYRVFTQHQIRDQIDQVVEAVSNLISEKIIDHDESRLVEEKSGANDATDLVYDVLTNLLDNRRIEVNDIRRLRQAGLIGNRHYAELLQKEEVQGS